MDLGNTKRYAAQFKGRRGWHNWTIDMVLRDRETPEQAKADYDCLVGTGRYDEVRIVEIETTVREFCF